MPNRLASESSPYLRQHAENPVEWYPWGPEAFERARQEDKPLLISIGYSTCHWCHVMERESFENPAIAAVMNRHLVCVKVDREERPDVDRIYMSAVQAQTGQGGWPLNVFVTPEGEPFIGGTYFPPEDRYGRRGWPAVVDAIGMAWKDPSQRTRLMDQGKNLAHLLTDLLTPQKPSEPALDPVTGAENCFKALDQSFDPLGGFSPAPKFPMPVNQHFLFRYAACTGGDKGRRALSLALDTLRAMARGGIFDHVGGGFHRYSTDGEWFLPHFEKMLYDNAQLGLNYIEAYQLSGDPEFARTATLTLDYLLRDLRHPAGGFYSAEDADSLPPGSPPGSEAKEGAFYLWGEAELREVLGVGDAALVGLRYGVKPDGSVAADPHGEFVGGNHLHEVLPLPEVARAMDLPVFDVAVRLEGARQRLLERRSKRPRPFRDEKILTAWNGLALSALARGFAVLGEERFLHAAQEAVSFLKKNLWDGGRLFRRWGDGARAVSGMASDHVFLAQGLVDLYEADFNPAHLLWAEQLLDETLKWFQDPSSGALFTTTAGHDPLALVRAKEEGDQVEPSSVSVAVTLLVRLARLRAREDFRLAAERMASAHLGGGQEGARAFPHLRATLLLNQRPMAEIVIAGPLSGPGTQALLRVVRKKFLPQTIVLLVEGDATQATLSERLPFLKEMRPVGGKPTAYFCQSFACRAPTSEPGILQESVDRLFDSL